MIVTLTRISIHVNVTSMNPSRAYSMDIRGKKAAATRERVLEVTQDLFAAKSTEFTLENVASKAGISVQTVLRAFGSKEKLILDAMGSFRATVPPRDALPQSVGEAVATLFDDYEVIGDRVIGMLAEEHRIPGLAEVAAEGRTRHRAWVEAALADELGGCPARVRRALVPALLAATDVYVWKLLRRDLGLDRNAAQAAVERLVRGVLINDKGKD
jgi:AcrR family transcriptional regulator